MAASFYFDEDPQGLCRHPQNAVAMLRSHGRPTLNGFDYHHMSGVNFYYQHQKLFLKSVVGRGGVALLMSGTTSELQAALDAAINANAPIRYLENTDTPTAVWYIRRNAGTFTKTLVSIASLPAYWRYHFDDPRQTNDKHGWYNLATDVGPIVDLVWLRDVLLPYAKGQNAWRGRDD